jgi:hypothetical protein
MQVLWCMSASKSSPRNAKCCCFSFDPPHSVICITFFDSKGSTTRETLENLEIISQVTQQPIADIDIMVWFFGILLLVC